MKTSCSLLACSLLFLLNSRSRSLYCSELTSRSLAAKGVTNPRSEGQRRAPDVLPMVSPPLSRHLHQGFLRDVQAPPRAAWVHAQHGMSAVPYAPSPGPSRASWPPELAGGSAGWGSSSSPLTTPTASTDWSLKPWMIGHRWPLGHRQANLLVANRARLP
jgi:hypothetical protein